MFIECLSFVCWVGVNYCIQKVSDWENSYIVQHCGLNSQPLWDIVHTLSLNCLPVDVCIQYKWVPDILVFVSVLYIIEWTLFFQCHSILVILRFVCASVTRLPPTHKLTVRKLFGFLECNYQFDFIFSGHVCICFLSYLCSVSVQPLYLSIVCAITSVITREHYSVDVLVAFMASYCVYALNTS